MFPGREYVTHANRLYEGTNTTRSDGAQVVSMHIPRDHSSAFPSNPSKTWHNHTTQQTAGIGPASLLPNDRLKHMMMETPATQPRHHVYRHTGLASTHSQASGSARSLGSSRLDQTLSSHRDGSVDFESACEDYVREYNRLGRLALTANDVQQAQSVLSQAIELVERDLPHSTILRVLTYNNLGCLEKRMGRPVRSLEYLERAIALLSSARGAGINEESLAEIDMADIHLNISAALSQLGRHEPAMVHLEAAINVVHQRLSGASVLQALGPEENLRNARLLVVAHYNYGAEQQALKMAAEGLESFRKLPAPCICERASAGNCKLLAPHT
jgi:tetratricopeptide (TPR) repeat protein